jgi:hypothetical protein
MAVVCVRMVIVFEEQTFYQTTNPPWQALKKTENYSF